MKGTMVLQNIRNTCRIRKKYGVRIAFKSHTSDQKVKYSYQIIANKVIMQMQKEKYRTCRKITSNHRTQTQHRNGRNI